MTVRHIQLRTRGSRVPAYVAALWSALTAAGHHVSVVCVPVRRRWDRTALLLAAERLLAQRALLRRMRVADAFVDTARQPQQPTRTALAVLLPDAQGVLPDAGDADEVWAVDIDVDGVVHPGSSTRVTLRSVRGDRPPVLAQTQGSAGSYYASVCRAAWCAVDVVVAAVAQLDLPVASREPTSVASHPSVALRGRDVLRQTWQRALSKPTRQHWWIGLHKDNPAVPSTWAAFDAPGGDFVADPCLCSDDGHLWLTYEEYVAAQGRGRLCVREVHNNGDAIALGAPQVLLERAHHLSYPMVQRVGDQLVLVPEQRAARQVELFGAKAMPGPFVSLGVVLHDVDMVDPTLLVHDGHYYLFGAVPVASGSVNECLVAFVADRLLGPYRPHPCNPLVRDITCARPAGPMWRDDDGTWLRPAQDCARAYGDNVVFKRVLQLSPTTFHEVFASALPKPYFPGSDGAHTFSRAGGVVAVDLSSRERGTP